MDFTNDYNGFVIALFFLAPQINAFSNHFMAVDISNNLLGWNNIQADEAEQDIRDFLYSQPIVGSFFKNRTDVKVDKNNKTVRADFKGALPGIRFGISIGV